MESGHLDSIQFTHPYIYNALLEISYFAGTVSIVINKKNRNLSEADGYPMYPGHFSVNASVT